MRQQVITINDPDTVALLSRYAAYVASVDGIEAPMDAIAESLMLGMLDEHWQFQSWCKNEAPTSPA